MSRRCRAVLAVLVSLLLLGMQQEGLRHALTHFHPAAAERQISQAPTDPPCAECALLAAGSAALTHDAPPPAATASVYVAPPPALVAPALAPPSYYRSRAPPSLS